METGRRGVWDFVAGKTGARRRVGNQWNSLHPLCLGGVRIQKVNNGPSRRILEHLGQPLVVTCITVAHLLDFFIVLSHLRAAAIPYLPCRLTCLRLLLEFYEMGSCSASL